MPMDSVTNENVSIIIKEKENTERELELLISTSLSEMWLHELEILENEYINYKQTRENIQNNGKSNEKKTKMIKKIKK